jgi:hypothetical protein
MVLRTLAFTLAMSTTLAAASANGVRQETIGDPGLHLTAYTVTVPSDWRFEGAFVAGSPCVAIPSRSFAPTRLTA